MTILILCFLFFQPTFIIQLFKCINEVLSVKKLRIVLIKF